MEFFKTLDSYGPVFGPFLYVIFLSLYVTACLPTEPIEFVPGFLFGWWKGALIILLGKLLGLTFSMIIGRYLFRDKIRTFVYRKFPNIRRISQAIAQEGFFAIVILRSLALPAAVKNYGIAACLDDVTFLSNILAATINLIPHGIMWGWVGESAKIMTLSTNDEEIQTSKIIQSLLPDYRIILFIVIPLGIWAFVIFRNVRNRFNQIMLEETE